ncbi:MAG: hypothetical protein ACOY3P_18680 [Planctomycetota bacterium]
MMQHPLWSVVVLVFASVFTFTLVVLFPVQILLVERGGRRKGRREKLTVADIVGLPFGAFNPDAAIPRWISYPILAVFWALVVLIAVGLVFRLVLGWGN